MMGAALDSGHINGLSADLLRGESHIYLRTQCAVMTLGGGGLSLMT